VHEARQADLGGGPDRRHGAVHVDAPHRRGVVDAQLVDPRDVEGEVGAVHAARQRVGVEGVAAHDLGAALGERGRGLVGARQGHDLVAARDQALHERAADHPAAARDEDAAHEMERSEAENFSR
jgi:hypothetical protein